VNFCDICGREDNTRRPLALAPVLNLRSEKRTACINCRTLINGLVFKETGQRRKLSDSLPPTLTLDEQDKRFLAGLQISLEEDR
jgi:hypothetical protein